MPFLGRSGPQKHDCQFKLRFCTDIFLFGTGNTLFGQIGPKNQNCQFKLKCGT